MSRRSKLPLFKSLEPDAYLVDTSSWLNIDERRDREEVWRLVVNLIEKGRLFTCAQVLDELRDNPIYLIRLKRHERALLAGDRRTNDVEYLQHVGKVTYEHPAMSRATGRKTPADPFLVALAELEGYVIVADETRRKRPNRKIPGVCQARGVRCITLSEFVAAAKKDASFK
ncbi:MAG TPA: DUF4411 family protein [Verrucomicrobiae bacterium]|jgi:hypothetical protein|nr:DUF4411 family protein [Verrucomicrobiae bacterium]